MRAVYDPDRHHRRSIRLRGYDYRRPGVYFITICTHNRKCLFGDVVGGQMQLNVLGNVARRCWMAIPNHFPYTKLDEFIVMPNHVHGIIWIMDDPDRSTNMVGAKNFSPPKTIGSANTVGVNVGANVGAKDLSPLHPRGTSSGTSKTIGSIVRGFKIGVTKWARQNSGVFTVWQRNYFEHVIRNDESLNRIHQYIAENPLRWHLDRENPKRIDEDNVWEEMFGNGTGR